MRGVKSFLVLLIVLLAVGGFALYEWRSGPVSSDAKDKVFEVESGKIEEISVKSESGDRTTLKKSGDDWQIVEPIAANPDSAEISGLTSNLSSLEVQRIIDENPPDLAEYGLQEPRVEVAFKSDGQERRLQIGRKTPPGTDLYAKRADQPRVFLISSYLDSTFNKSTFDLRDKSVLRLERDAIDAMAIATPDRTLRFSKADGEWQIVEPLKARADFTAVDGIVSRLNTLQMKSVAAAEPSGLSEYGLDTPAATVQLGSGSSQATLLVGGAAGEGAIYAKDQSRPAVVTVDASLLDELKKPAGDYRQKDLVDARAFNATRLEVVRNGQTTVFEKTKTKNAEGQDEEKWRKTAPAAADVDQAKLDNLLSAVTLVRANEFVESTAKAGLDKPELAVTIASDEGKRTERVTFGRAGSDAYASREGEPGAAKIDAATLDNIVKSLEELK